MKCLWFTLGLILLASGTLGDDTDELIKFLNKDVTGLLVYALKQLNLQLNDTHLQPTGPLIKGYFNMTNAKLSGLGNIDTTVKNIIARKALNASYADTTIRLPIKQVSFSLDYDMDLVVLNKVPLYGAGQISINVELLEIGLNTQFLCEKCEFLAPYYLPNAAENLSLSLFVKHKKPHITGLFRHPEADRMVTLIADLAEQAICMWFDYNAECLDCIVNPFVSQLINSVLSDIHGNPLNKTIIEVDCICLQDSYGKQFQIQEKLNKILGDIQKGDTDTLIKDLLSRDFQILYDDIFVKVKEFLKTIKEFGDLFKNV